MTLVILVNETMGFLMSVKLLWKTILNYPKNLGSYPLFTSIVITAFREKELELERG